MELNIPLVLQNKTPIYLQIYEYMKRGNLSWITMCWYTPSFSQKFSYAA